MSAQVTLKFWLPANRTCVFPVVLLREAPVKRNGCCQQSGAAVQPQVTATDRTGKGRRKLEHTGNAGSSSKAGERQKATIGRKEGPEGPAASFGEKGVTVAAEDKRCLRSFRPLHPLLPEGPAPAQGQAGPPAPPPRPAEPSPGTRPSPSSAYRRPPQRDVPRADKHGAEVVVEDHDGPVEEHDEVDASPGGVQGPVPQRGVRHGGGGAHGHHGQGHQRPPVAQAPRPPQPPRPAHGRYRRPPAAAAAPPPPPPPLPPLRMAPAALSPAPSRRLPRQGQRREEGEEEGEGRGGAGARRPGEEGGERSPPSPPPPPAQPAAAAPPLPPAVRWQ